MKLVRISS